LAGTLFYPPKAVPIVAGAVVPGGKLTFSQTGGTTPQDTYTDEALTVASSNPVVADANGVFAAIYLDPSLPSYRVKFTDADDTLIYQLDNIPSEPTITPTSLLLPQVDEIATPTLRFGDGDSGVMESADDVLKVIVVGEIGIVISGNGGIDLYYNNIKRLSTNASGIVDLFSDTSTDTEVRRLNLNHQDGTMRAQVGFDINDILYFHNGIHGGSIAVQAEDSGGTARTILNGDSDTTTTVRANTDLHLEAAAGEDAIIATANAGVAAYFNDIKRLSTLTDGSVAIYSDGNTDTGNRALLLSHQDGTTRGSIAYSGTDSLVITNAIHGGNVSITAEDTGGTQRTGLDIDPDATTTLRADTNLLLEAGAGTSAMSFFFASNDIIHQVNPNVGLTADTGSSQGDGVITSSFNVYTTVATIGDAATMPGGFNAGTLIYIKNDGANSMDVFPSAGHHFYGVAVNAAIAIAAGDFAIIMATVTNDEWTKIAGGTA